jgi:hypothetical protein
MARTTKEDTVRPDPNPGDFPPEEAEQDAEARGLHRESVSRKAEDELQKSTDFTSQHPLRHRDPLPRKEWQTPQEGELKLVDEEGRSWEPISCGVHRSAPSFREPDGFQPDCSACQEELNSTLESAQKYATV